ncbi:class I histocompatibility antigen, F10 alpha chain-like isoform X1 [Nerophis ophidion]|uniref:class I histocompatibility antigen, F10 alpha chain-like isoform X1 n=1 Tax=Nerophis ophidion TaxID=159077 RepID=UPI002ADF8122|nr:class I histocompatibility antigen, F10 alpha chain-like isoform X1 [Nerophis ophidion]
MMNLLCFFLLVVQTHSVTPVIHTLQYFTTACSQVPNFPEYVEVGYVDEVEVSYYDSNIRKTESKQDWMNKITAEDPNYWKIETEYNLVREHVYKDNIERLRKHFNQTGGVHTFQEMTGCEWNDETDEVKGWHQFSYDGEDFISLDMKTWTFTAAKQQAFPTKLKWDQDTLHLDDLKYYYTEICPSYLKKYVEYGKKVLMRTGGCNNNANTQQFHSIYAKLAVHCGIEASKTGNATTKILPMVEDSEDSIPGAFKVVPRSATLKLHYFLNNTRPIMYSIFAQSISIRPILPIPAWILLGIGSE